MNFVFQLALLALIFVSCIIVVSVPIIFSSGYEGNLSKNYLLVTSTSWLVLVLLVGALNSFVI